MPRLVDLTHGFYEGMPSYPAPWFPTFTTERAMSPDNDPNGTERTFSTLHLFPHNATHMEYRLHFYPGAEGIDAVPLETLVGRACVADLSYKGDLDPVTGEDLEKQLSEVWQRGDRLLIRTDYVRRAWGREDYWDKPPYLTPSAAEWAIDNGACLVGFDCLTERPGDRESPVHHALLGAGVPLIEYMTNMHELSRQVVQLIALPIKVAGVEATPARVIAVEDDSVV
ncbi:cyclase family protein [Streptomyces hawaiiensis]|uniref:cyclase family protein n=1 Tax=Streptomyces hawaiiensis TaxID=67305 RepID=UPI00365E192E